MPAVHAQVFLSSPFYPRKDSLKLQAQPVTWIRLAVLVFALLVSDAVLLLLTIGVMQIRLHWILRLTHMAGPLLI